MIKKNSVTQHAAICLAEQPNLENLSAPFARRRMSRCAALLMAMLTVALVATVSRLGNFRFATVNE